MNQAENPRDKNLPVSKPINLDQYQDPEGLTLGKLKIGAWYVDNIRHIRSILTGFLAVLAAVLWGYYLFTFLKYAAFDMKNDNKIIQSMMADSVGTHALVSAAGPSQISFGPVLSFHGGEGRSDFAVEASNPNPKFIANLAYHFESAGHQTPTQRSTVYPEDRIFLVSPGNNFSSSQDRAALILESTNFQRIDARVIKNWQEFQKTHMDFGIIDPVFIAGARSGLSDKLNLAKIKFTAANQTAFNYRQIDFNIILYSGGAVAGVDKYRLADFRSGQSYDIDLSRAGQAFAVSLVEVYPELDIMDPSIYMDFE